MMPDRLFLFLCSGLMCAALLPACTPAPTPTPDISKSDFAIVGYLPDYRALDPEWGCYLTDIIYFSAGVGVSGELDTARLSERTLTALHDMRTTYGTRVFIAVGGWDRSQNLAAVATKRVLRKRFAQALTAYCLDNQLDGADLDWEFPQDERENRAYVALLAAIRRAFAPHGLQVSVALNAWQETGPELYRAVDRIHVMSYDHEGRHATFERSVADIQAFLARGAPPEKLLLGMPFYGRGVDERSRTLTYAEIVHRYRPAPEVNEAGGVYFNGIATIQQKTHYALEQRLGGVMIWELGQDTGDETSLLRAIDASRP
jgi:GH18 family chitinase